MGADRRWYDCGEAQQGMNNNNNELQGWYCIPDARTVLILYYYIDICVYVCICVFVCMCVYVCMCIYVYLCVFKVIVLNTIEFKLY